MSLWDEIGNAAATGYNPYFKEDGHYVVKLIRFSLLDGFHGLSFILESEIVWASLPDEDVGGVRSWVVAMGGDETKKRMGQGNIKSFIRAVFNHVGGSDGFDALVPALSARCAGASNPLAGLTMQLHTVAKDTKRKSVFTVHNWSPAPGFPSADVAAIMACQPAPEPGRGQHGHAPIATPPAGHWAAPPGARQDPATGFWWRETPSGWVRV